MLKIETIKELEKTFNYETEISEFTDRRPYVELVNLDLVRIHLYDRIHPETLKDIIVDILRNNDEPGPLKIHVETARSCKLTLYADISSF